MLNICKELGVTCSRTLWSTEFKNNSEEISKHQSFQAAVLPFLITYIEMKEERNDLKTEFIIKREASWKDVENPQPSQVKSEKVCLRDQTKGMTKNRWPKRLAWTEERHILFIDYWS